MIENNEHIVVQALLEAIIDELLEAEMIDKEQFEAKVLKNIEIISNSYKKAQIVENNSEKTGTKVSNNSLNILFGKTIIGEA